jgi:ABC-type transporter Mla MlaB component
LAAPERSQTTRLRAPRPRGEPSTIVVAVSGPIAPADVPELWEQVRMLEGGSNAGHLVCDVKALVHPDAAMVDALARLQLSARRFGRRLCFHDASRELRELLAMMGLSDAVPCSPASPRQPRGQAEEREEGRGVQEEAEACDLAGRELQHLQGPRLEATSGTSRLVLPERRRTVRDGGDQP